MVIEKIGWFKRRMGDIGKRLFFNKSEKMNLLLTSAIVQSTIEEYTSIMGGSLPDALKLFGEGVKAQALDLVTEAIETPILFGLKLAFLLSKEPSDIAIQMGFTFWGLAGKMSKEHFTKPKFISAEESEDNIAKVIIGVKKCPVCIGLTNVTEKDLQGEDYITVLSALSEAAIQDIQDYVGNKYKIVCKETKCFLRGDDQGEMTLYFHPIT